MQFLILILGQMDRRYFTFFVDGLVLPKVNKDLLTHYWEVIKKQKFYGQGGGSAPLALTIRKCENVNPFFH